tara:strand:- start:230 stop:2107 length:1878 start_codon:yes stop_codon:yes gene_type:complete
MSKNTRTLNATTVPALPSAPNKIDPNLKKFLDKMVEAVEIRLGRRGDPRDRAITLRELITSGLAKELAANPYDPNAIDFGVPLGDDLNLSQAVGKPENLTATAGFTAVLIKWDLWKHRNHFRTHVYRNTVDVRSTAVFIGTSDSQFYSDEDVTSGTTYYYWAKHENTHGDMSEWNAESGTSATVQPDVDFLLTTLTGEIRSSHLYTTLATDVGRIPGWHTIIGSYDPATQRTLTQLDTGVTTLTTQSGNNLSDLTALKTVLGGNTATAFTVLNSHVTDGTDATSVASQLTALNSTQGTQQATITQHATSIAGINAEYAVRVSIGASGNNRVSGFGLMANATTTDFGILADKFFIEAPQGSSVTQPAVTPFSVVTSAQTFTDSSGFPHTLPSGVYMDGAFIKFGSITEAHIGTATIDNAHITNTLDAAKIVTGEIDTGRIKLDGVTIDSNNNGRIEIPNLGVKVGKIDNAVVDTLQLAGNAATVPFGQSGAGGVNVGVNTAVSGSITGWTDISGGGVSISFGSNSIGYPSKVMVHLTTQMFASNYSGNNFTSLGLYIFNGTGWLEEGVVGFGMIDDQSHQITTGHTFVPNISSGASIIVKVYARKINTNSTVITGPSNLQVIGCRR